MKPTLLIMAAGMGSRYGGLKQIDPVGPGGETILDYSVYDAIKAGFGKIVFIIRRDIEQAFIETYVHKLQKFIEVEWVFQETDALPQGYVAPDGRTKPWGTGHAVLMARDNITQPFAVINADDFYGREAFATLSKYFDQSKEENEYAMVAYRLKNTLSDFGTVSRGVCVSNERNELKDVTERTGIESTNGNISYSGPDEERVNLPDDTLVSMNFWGFKPGFFNYLERHFKLFLNKNANSPTAEFYIPAVVDQLIKDREIKVKLLKNDGHWFGITYQQDKPEVINKIAGLIREGVYPPALWE
ncbi:nucleotidyltransferase [Lentimicrobium sp.]